MPEALPETGVLGNHSSDFSLLKWTQSTQTDGHTDLVMVVAYLAYLAGPYNIII